MSDRHGGLSTVLDRIEGSLVLEVGCGSDPCVPTVVGIDLDAAALSVARRAGFNLAVVGDVAALPVRPAAFDAVIAAGLLHHLAEWDGALAEIARALRPHGHLLILEMAPLSEDDYEEMNRQLVGSGGATDPRNGVSEQEIDTALEACGLERVRSEPAGSWSSATPPWTDRVFSSGAWLHHAVRRPP